MKLIKRTSRVTAKVFVAVLVLGGILVWVVAVFEGVFGQDRTSVQGEPDGGYQVSNVEEVRVARVVGMGVGEACRELARTGPHAGRVSDVRPVEGVRPGLVVAQKPAANTVPEVETVVDLTLSGPFSEEEIASEAVACEDSGGG